jgi:uncharacterized protein YndB with AHSA1/START domain
MTIAADATATDRKLSITRLLDAPRSLVFEAWTKHEHLRRWCGPRDFAVTHGEGDIRPGGA